MHGKGTYIFPDGSALSATWKDNSPDGDFLYKDPIGYNWQGEASLNKEVIFFIQPNFTHNENFYYKSTNIYNVKKRNNNQLYLFICRL
jgi:hypothetical protein